MANILVRHSAHKRSADFDYNLVFISGVLQNILVEVDKKDHHFTWSQRYPMAYTGVIVFHICTLPFTFIISLKLVLPCWQHDSGYVLLCHQQSGQINESKNTLNAYTDKVADCIVTKTTLFQCRYCIAIMVMSTASFTDVSMTLKMSIFSSSPGC